MRSGSSCYYRFTESKSLNESREDCEARGGQLMILNSTEKQVSVSKCSCVIFDAKLDQNDVCDMKCVCVKTLLCKCGLCYETACVWSVRRVVFLRTQIKIISKEGSNISDQILT